MSGAAPGFESAGRAPPRREPRGIPCRSLRRAERLDAGECEYKLTQKVPAARPGTAQGLITNTYLIREEYEVLARLPAAVLTKTRLSVPPFGIDVFAPPPDGLVLAEAEFTTDAAARSFPAPSESVAEVTADPRFTGGRLVRTSRDDLLAQLAEYGVTPATG